MKKWVIVVGVVILLLLVAIPAFSRSSRKQYDVAMWTAAIEKAYKVKLSDEQKDAVREIIRSFEANAGGDYRLLVYIFATAWHESKLKPVRELRANRNRQPQLYEQQNRYWPSGYFGRGFVQITWKTNYEKFTVITGYDLINNPNLALQTSIAAEILVYGMLNGSFTRRKLSQYINLLSTDYKNARRVVNGLDRADLIAGYARSLEAEVRNGLLV